MARIVMFLTVLWFVSALPAQTRECPQTQQEKSCTTCTPQEPDDTTKTQYSLGLTAVAYPCPSMPTGDCHPCCWEFSMTFTAGTTVDYANTFIQVGNGTKKTTSSPSLHIGDEKNTTCTTDGETTHCVKFNVQWLLMPTWTVCWELKCKLCPAPPI